MASQASMQDGSDTPSVRSTLPENVSNLQTAAPTRQKTGHRFQPRNLHVRAWFWEFLASILSLACMGAIVAVLLYEDGKSLRQWNLIIPPNAVVSFIATLAKSSALLVLSEVISQMKWNHFGHKPRSLYDFETFDAASRGPLGSIKLIFRKYKQASLASCAAALIIVALLVDPFVQLTIRFPSKLMPSPLETASFLKSQTYDPIRSGVESNLVSSDDPLAVLSVGMQAAIITGLTDPTIELDSTCSTGNCTFSETTTLTICSKCANVTAQTENACDMLDLDGSILSTCNYTFPDGTRLGAQRNEDTSTGERRVSWQTRYNASITHVMDVTGNITGDQAILLSFDSLSVQESTSQADFNQKPYQAWHCELYFCARTYESISTVNGTTQVSEAQDQPLTVLGASDHDGYSMLTLSSSAAGNSSTTYQVNEEEATSLANYLDQGFSTGWVQDAVSRDGYMPVYFSVYTIPSQWQKLATEANTSSVSDALAASMSEYIRTGRNSTAQAGQTFVWESYINARWGWLALPISMAVMSTVLLILTIWEGKRSGRGLWKSSALAVLFHRLEGWDPVIDANSPRELESAAKDMRGILEDARSLSITPRELYAGV